MSVWILILEIPTFLRTLLLGLLSPNGGRPSSWSLEVLDSMCLHTYVDINRFLAICVRPILVFCNPVNRTYWYAYLIPPKYYFPVFANTYIRYVHIQTRRYDQCCKDAFRRMLFASMTTLVRTYPRTYLQGRWSTQLHYAWLSLDPLPVLTTYTK